MGRSVAAIAVAWLLWSALWIGFNQAAQAAFPTMFDPTRRLVLVGPLTALIAWSAVCSVAAGYVCAWVKRSTPMATVWALAFIQLVVGIGFEVSYWSLLPAWYHLVFLALLVPATVWGGRLRTGGVADPA